MEEKRKECCWKARHGGETCGRELHDEEHCVFHSQDIEGKKARFDDLFWKEFERQEKEEEKLDFSGFVFPGDISFEGKEFKKDVFFKKAQFSGEANFSEAQFSGEASFYDTQFSGVVIFYKAKFSGLADFTVAEFIGLANFNTVQFSGKAVFFHPRFSEYAGFSGSQFSGEANFSEAQFSEEAYFSYVLFSAMAAFDRTTFSKKVYFIDVQFVDISKLSMKETYFHDVSHLLEILDHNKKDRGIPGKAKTEFLSDDIQIVLGDMSAARYPILNRQVQDDWFLFRFHEKHPKLHFLWWLFADCGRSILKWGLWSLLFAEVFSLIFGFVYYFDASSFKSEVISFSWPGISFLYYSIVTFTTLGFGDIVPKTPGLQIVIMLEVILGYIMLGGLISILANKLARRS